MEIDTPLDDVIAKKRSERKASKKAKRSLKPTSSTSTRSRSQTQASVRSGGTGKATAVSTQPTQALPSDSSKIVVSNLPDDVTETQVKELFESTIGPIKRLVLNYNSHGRSSGTASIEFRRSGDGSKACTQYNGRLIDNKRPMKVEIIVDPARIPKPPLSTRVAPPPKEAAPATKKASQGKGKERAGSGRKGRGRGGRRGGSDRPQVTAEELDAQMDAYVAEDTPAAGT